MSTGSTFRHIAVLDIGKTNAKVVVVDGTTGAEIAALRTSNTVLKSDPYPHYDIEGLWAFALDALASLASSPGFDAISITTHGASIVLLAGDGSLALPVLDYEHDYPASTRDAYDHLRPPFAETFSPRLSAGLNVGAQLHYQKTTFPERFADVRTILTYPQYWAWRLSGVAANEVTSLGCHTDLWNPQAGDYSSLIDRLDIGHLMAPIRPAFDALGPVLPDIAARIGLPAPVPVYCGIHDSNASLLPHLVAHQAPFAVVSTGTWVINFGVGGDLRHLDPSRDTLANVDAYGRAVPSSRFMGGREFEMLSAEFDLATIEAEAVETTLRAVIAKGAMLLPNVIQGSGPFQGRQARWICADGLSPSERYAVVSLYLALMTETCLGLIGAKGPIFVEGPFALNSAYLAALSALTASSVVALPGSTGTSQGAALLAGLKPEAVAAHPDIRVELPEIRAYRQAWNQAIGELAAGE